MERAEPITCLSVLMVRTEHMVPPKAGFRGHRYGVSRPWVPAFAGMTKKGRLPSVKFTILAELPGPNFGPNARYAPKLD